MDAGLRDLRREALELRPGPALPAAVLRSPHTTQVSESRTSAISFDSTEGESVCVCVCICVITAVDSRQHVGARPRRRVLDVVVARYVLRDDDHLVLLVLREEVRAGQPRHAGPGLTLESGSPR